jgi:hypothetical protein
MQDILMQGTVQPRTLLEHFTSFSFLAALDVSTEVENWKAGHHSLEEYEKEIQNYQEVGKYFKTLLP